MGLMDNMFGFLFGDGAQKTIEIFKENAERTTHGRTPCNNFKVNLPTKDEDGLDRL